MGGLTEGGWSEEPGRRCCRILLLAVRAAVQEGGFLVTKYSSKGLDIGGSGLLFFVIGRGYIWVPECLRTLYWVFKMGPFVFLFSGDFF